MTVDGCLTMQILYIDIFNRFKLFKFPAFVPISSAMLFRAGPELQFVHHPVSPGHGRITAVEFLNFYSGTV